VAPNVDRDDTTVDFTGQVVVVTGGTRGVGRGITGAFLAAGAHVVICGRTEPAPEQLPDAGGRRATFLTADVRDAEQAASVLTTTAERFGRVDVLVNNAGILRDKSFLKLDEAMWDAVVEVHLKGTFLCSQVFAKQLVAQGGGGRIVNTTSVSGMLGNFGQANYSAAKAGIYGLTRTMSIELQKHRVTVNALAPIAKTGRADRSYRDRRPHAVIHGNGQGGTDGMQQDGRYFLGIYLYQQTGSRAASGLTTAAANSI